MSRPTISDVSTSHTHSLFDESFTDRTISDQQGRRCKSCPVVPDDSAPAILKLNIRLGLVQINHKDRASQAPLHRAATTGSVSLLQLLLNPPEGRPKTRLNGMDRAGMSLPGLSIANWGVPADYARFSDYAQSLNVQVILRFT